MDLEKKIDEGMKEALKKGEKEELSLFRMLKSALKNAEIEKRDSLDEAEAVAVLEKQAKQRRDSIEQYEKGGRPELAEAEKKELVAIESFLPQKMDEAAVRAVVKEKIAAMPEADFGPVMGACMAELKGKADGGLVQKIVKEEKGL